MAYEEWRNTTKGRIPPMSPPGSEWGPVTEEWQAQQALKDAYATWLYQYLYMLQFTEEGGDLGDPTKEGTSAYKLLTQVANQIDSGANIASMPMFGQFYETYQTAYPQTAGMTDQETAYMESETAYNLARVQDILNTIAQSGQVSPDTEAELEYLTKKLEFDMRQANLGNQLDWEEFGLKKQQLELQRNEWLAELQANPATWTERWAAEHMPWGGQRIPLESDKVLAQAQATPSWSKTASTSATASLPGASSWTMPDMAARSARFQAPRIGRTP